MNLVKEAIEKSVKITQTNLFDQNKLVFQKLEAIMNPDLVLKSPKVLIILGFLRFHFKVVVRVAFLKKVKFLRI